MDDDGERNRMAVNARAKALSFTVESVMAMWMELFDGLRK